MLRSSLRRTPESWRWTSERRPSMTWRSGPRLPTLSSWRSSARGPGSGNATRWRSSSTRTASTSSIPRLVSGSTVPRGTDRCPLVEVGASRPGRACVVSPNRSAQELLGGIVAAGDAAALRATARAGQRPGLGGWFRKHTFELVLIAPLVLYVLILTVAPIIDTFRLSFSSPRGGFGTVGSYDFIFKDNVFRRAVVNTLIVALLSLALEVGVGLAIALALHVKFKGRGFVRTVLLVPLGVPTIVSGAVMLLIFARSGYMNSVLGLFTGLIDKIPGVHLTWTNVSWTAAGGTRTILTYAIADMWKVLPIMTLIFLAGLQSIPEDVYEAADVDGATKWQRFLRVTLPLLIPYFTMALILRAIDAFWIFELALALGANEPVLGNYIGKRYLAPTNDPFTEAAASIVLFGIIMLFIVLYLRFVARFQVQR